MIDPPAQPPPGSEPPNLPARTVRRFVSIFGLTALLVAVIGYREQRAFEAFETGDKLAQLGAVADLKAEWVAQWRRERIGDAAAIGITSSLADLLAIPDDADVPPGLHGIAAQRFASMATYRQYRAVYLLDMNGRVRLTWPAAAAVPGPELLRVFARTLRERKPLLDDALGPASDAEPQFVAGTPVTRMSAGSETAPAGEPVGVVLLAVDPDASLSPFLASWPTSLQTAENHLVRRDGADVVFLESGSRSGHRTHVRRLPLTRAQVLAVQAATGAVGPVRGIAPSGEAVLGAVRLIPEAGWAVVTHMDVAELQAELRGRMAAVIGLAALVLLATGALLALALVHLARRSAQRHGVLAGALAAKSSALDDLVARSPAVVYALDEVDGRVRATRMTANMQRVLGYTVEEALGPDWWPANVHPNDLHLGRTVFEHLHLEDAFEYEYRFRHKDGRWRWVRDRLEVARRQDGRPVECVGSLEDVTDRRLAERALAESEERLRMALMAGQQGLFDLDMPTGRVVVSPGFAIMLGHDPDTFSLTYDDWVESLHPEDRGPAMKTVEEYLGGRMGEVYHAVFRMRTATGAYRWISSTGRLLTRDAEGRPLRMLGTHTDITSLKTAQLDAQRITRLYAALSRSAEAVVRNREVVPLLQQVCEAAVYDGGFDMAWAGFHEPATGDIRRVAEAGRALEYLEGLAVSTQPNDPTRIGPAAQSILTDAPAGFDDLESADFDAAWKQRALSLGWRSILAFPLRRGGRPIGTLVLYARTPAAFDEAARRLLGQMTENVGYALDALAQDARRVVAEAEVRRSLGEREALLKEIHHRVKNNLQVITSLLRLEANRSSAPDVRAVLVEMKNRVISMALLHELLYRSDTLASVNLATYLAELARQVFESSALHAGIRFESRIDPVAVDLDQAVPCGLLVNELLANALKHAYPNGRRGVVRLTVSHALDPATGADAVAITVEDDGVGLAPDFENRRKRSLGLQMVTDLTRQLDGTLEIDAPSGARFRVRFERRGTIAAHGRPSLPPTAPPETVPASNPGRS